MSLNDHEGILRLSPDSMRTIKTAFCHLEDALARRKKATQPSEVRNATIVCLSGLITLTQEMFGPEQVRVAIELQGALEDLNKGTVNDIFLPCKTVRGGRPPASRDKHAVLATASALVNYKQMEHGLKEDWIRRVANSFGIKKETLISFTKKVTSKKPPSDIAMKTYEKVREQLSSCDVTPEEALSRISSGFSK